MHLGFYISLAVENDLSAVAVVAELTNISLKL